MSGPNRCATTSLPLAGPYVTDTAAGATITCPDGTATVIDGTNGNDGDNGTNGQPGTNGVGGTDGSDGLACWDLDADGSCDLGTEDIDDSGVCDVLDCRGADGSDGPVVARSAVCSMTVGELIYTYYIVDFENSSVLASCFVDDPQYTISATLFYDASLPGRTTAPCSVRSDTGAGDGYDGGGYVFSRTAREGTYSVTYLDDGDPANGWVGTYTAGDCNTVTY